MFAAIEFEKADGPWKDVKVYVLDPFAESRAIGAFGLEDIFEHIASENPSAASEVIEGIFQRAQVLLDFPESGYRYESSPENVRVLLYGHYRIAYVVRVDSNIDILGVFHGALDLEKYFP